MYFIRSTLDILDTSTDAKGAIADLDSVLTSPNVPEEVFASDSTDDFKPCAWIRGCGSRFCVGITSPSRYGVCRELGRLEEPLVFGRSSHPTPLEPGRDNELKV